MLIDRDATPALPERFAVTAYPTILVLDAEHANVWRWSSFQKPDLFVASLDEALRRDALRKRGERFDAPPTRPPRIVDAQLVETWPAPSDDVPWGIARLGDALWVGRGGRLFETDPATHAVRRAHDVGTWQDLTSDGRHLWLLPAGWTSGEPLRVVDAATGATVREVATAANEDRKGSAARGIASHAAAIYVLEIDGRLFVLDPDTGDVLRSEAIGANWVYGLCSTGSELITGARDGLLFVDPATLRTTRKLATHYWIRGVGWDADRILCQEQPVMGFDRNHRAVRWYPDPTVTHAITLVPDDAAVVDGTLPIALAGELPEPAAAGHVQATVGAEHYTTVDGLARAVRAVCVRHPALQVRIVAAAGVAPEQIAAVRAALEQAGVARFRTRPDR